MKFTQILALVIVWRVALTIISFIAPQVLSYQPAFPYTEAILQPLGPKQLYAWANFDGVHYLTIIQKGYEGTGSIQAFFPLYPIIVSFLTKIFLNPILAGIILSTLSLTVGLYFFQKLLKLDRMQAVSRQAILLMLFFPTSFFFTAVYTESFFYMLVIMSFYYARTGKFLSAALIAALASATRIIGIILLPALLIEYFDQTPKVKAISHRIKHISLIAFSAAGLLAYMAYLKSVFNDSLLFLHVQSQFGAGRQVDKLVMLYQVFYRYIKMALTVQKNSWLYYTVITEFIVAILFLATLLLAFKYVRRSYVVFALIAFLVPTLTGTFTSLPRYVLVLFPAFITIAKILPKQHFKIFLFFSGILLIINTILFIQGYWVA